MADVITDGLTRVAYVLTIANAAAPTTTELNAGTSLLLHDTMTSDGLNGFNPATADVPTSKFSSTFDTMQPGRVSYSNPTLRFCKQVAPDLIYNTLSRATTGFIVIRRGLAAATAWASTQVIEVYPIVCGERVLLDPAPNTLQRWESPLKLSAQPTLNAAVA
jgi:hypothetical protein